MADVTLTITEIAANAATSQPAAGVLADIADADVGIIPASDTQGLFIEVTNTTAGEKDFTVKAGENPPAPQAGQGDLVVPLAQDAVALIALESGRFAQADGTIHVDAETGMTGDYRVYRVGV